MQNLELLEKAKNGDAQAFSEIYEQFADRIYKYIRFKIQEQTQAEDVLQEVFIKAWRGMPGLAISPDVKFSAWLYKIAQNAINDHLRKVYRSPDMQELDENLPVYQKDSTEDSMDKSMVLTEVKAAFDYLPIQYKQILELRYIQDLTVDEVCEVTGKSNLAVRLAQHRALKQLRKIILEKYGNGRK